MPRLRAAVVVFLGFDFRFGLSRTRIKASRRFFTTIQDKKSVLLKPGAMLRLLTTSLRFPDNK
jgi:hypothetical protein